MLYERTAISKKPEQTIINDLTELKENNKMTTDYYIDLLFYHRKLRRLVVIELKLGKFLPEHKGKVELYLRWLKKYEMAKEKFEVKELE